MPLNVLFGAIPLPRLAELGVARVSTGSLLYRVALGAATTTAAAVRDGGRGLDAPSYADVDAPPRNLAVDRQDELAADVPGLELRPSPLAASSSA